MTATAIAQTCRKCGGPMRPGIATGQTYTSGAPDFPGSDCATMSAGWPGVIINVMKCRDCGASYSL